MSSSSRSYPVHDFLTRSESPLAALITRARAIDDLNQALHQFLDPEWAAHCRVGTFENGILTLYAESAAYATQIRYQIPTILSTLRNFSQWANLRSIQVKVQTFNSIEKSLPDTSSQKSPTLTKNSIAQIESLVQTLKNQPGTEDLVKNLEKFISNT